MKYVAVFALMIFAGCARATWQENPGSGAAGQSQNPPTNPTKPTDPEPALGIPFEICASQTLNVTIDTTKSTSATKDVLKVAERFPQMRFTKAARTKAKTVYYVNARDASRRSCNSISCAETAGWTQIQAELNGLNDVTIVCEGT